MSCLPCWACACECEGSHPCPDCGAPPWPVSYLEQPFRDDGVYVVRAHCGLVKIGYSGISVDRRVAALRRASKQEELVMLCALRGASMDVERWLHSMFADVRDRNWALMHRLPHETEWFWPSPAIDRLVAETEFIRDGRPWEEHNIGASLEIA